MFVIETNNYILKMVYDEHGLFRLDSSPETLERLYRFLIECTDDDKVINFIEKEFIRLEQEYKEWMDLLLPFVNS